MSECAGKDCPIEKNIEAVEKEAQIITGLPEQKIPKIQYVSVTLADGRKGVFAGPELIPNAELLLAPPRLVSIDFSQPMEYPKPQPVGTPEVVVETKEEPKPEEKPQ